MRLVPGGRKQHGTAADDDPIEEWNYCHAVGAEQARLDPVDTRARLPRKSTVLREFSNSPGAFTVGSLGLVRGENPSARCAGEAVNVVNPSASRQGAKESWTLWLTQIESERPVPGKAVREQDLTWVQRVFRVMGIKCGEADRPRRHDGPVARFSRGDIEDGEKIRMAPVLVSRPDSQELARPCTAERRLSGLQPSR